MKNITFRKRFDFSKIPATIQIPNLIEVQKRSYERFCTSMRLGIWMVAGIFEKSNRFRLAVFCCAIYKAPNLCRSGSLAWLRKPPPCGSAMRTCAVAR